MNQQTRHLCCNGLALLGVILLMGCREEMSRVERMTREKVLLIGNGTEIETLDPHLSTGQPEHYVITSIFEGLVAPDALNPDAEAPGLATHWETDDFVQWIFHLRQDARWSDGMPITIDDVLYAWQRILSPELGSYYSEMLYVIEGAEAFHRGQSKDFSTVGVRALDAHRLQLRLTGPAPYLPGMMKHYSWFPVPAHVIEAEGGMLKRDNRWARPGKLVGSGPFELKRWNIQHLIAVKRNPFYWDADRVQLNGIHFFPIDSADTEHRAYWSNQLHVTNTVPMNRLPQYRAQRPPEYVEHAELAIEFYRFNTKRPPLNNPKVRRALTLAIDRQALVEKIIQSGHTPATAFVPPGAHELYPQLQRISFAPDQAAQFLAEAGYANGNGFPKLQILTNSSPAASTVAQFFQAQWKQHLGIEVGILQQEWQVYLQAQNRLEYDIARAGWVGDYVDPLTFLGIFRSGDGNNNTGWGNEDYDRLLRESASKKQVRERMALLSQAEEIFLDELPVAPIFWRMTPILKRPEVLNWQPSVLSHRCYKALNLLGPNSH